MPGQITSYGASRERDMPTFTQYYLANMSAPWLMSSHADIWQKVFDLGERKQWPKKALMYDLGDPVSELVLILDGLVKIVASNWNGELRTLGILGPGSILGEAAFFADSDYRHMIFCVEPCTGISFPRETVLQKILPCYQDLSLYLFKNLAGKSYMMSTQVECIQFMSSEQYIAHFLYHLAVEQKKKSWIYGKMSSLHLTTLAEVLGMHRVTVTKVVNNLKKQGIISQKQSSLVVNDADGLMDILRRRE